MYYVIILTVKNRKQNAIKVQEILTKYGSVIKTRLGLHETAQENQEGLIILHTSVSQRSEELAEKLNSIEGVHGKLVKID